MKKILFAAAVVCTLTSCNGTNIGNSQSINFTDTLTTERLTKDSLVLKDGERGAACGRTKDE